MEPVSSLQFEFFDHRLTPEAEEEVVCCQGRHGITGGIGGTSNMWENHCGRRELKETNGGQCELNMVISPS